MRLWSVHPVHLDGPGLTAAWREALLAQAVLAGRTRGYTRHPQLERFRASDEPLAAIGAFLVGLHDEATARGYSYDRSRIDDPTSSTALAGSMPVTDGQVAVEWEHLIAKLDRRAPEVAGRWRDLTAAEARVHPLLRRVPGPVASWERATR